MDEATIVKHLDPLYKMDDDVHAARKISLLHSSGPLIQ